MTSSRFLVVSASGAAIFALWSGGANADGQGLNGFAMPGSLNLPAAVAQDDGQLAFSLHGDDRRRIGALTFQATPGLTLSFRYGRYDQESAPLYDRSFDLQYLLADQDGWRPALAVGLRDFIGTGVVSSEYVVATSRLSQQVTLSGGIGWGALGVRGDLGAPFGERPPIGGFGGKFRYQEWFRGPAAPFALVDWQASDRLRLSLGWSGEAVGGDGSDKGMASVGAVWRVRSNVTVAAMADQAGSLGLGLSWSIDPKESTVAMDAGVPPRGFALEPLEGDGEDTVSRLKNALAAEGIALRGASFHGDEAVVRVENRLFGLPALAMGRTARVMSQHLPEETQVFAIEMQGKGPAASRMVMNRSDLERLQDAPERAEQGWATTSIGPAQPWQADWLEEDAPYDLALRPYVATSLFDPDQPLRADVGAELAAQVRVAPNLSVDGVLRVRVAGNRGASVRVSDSTLPPVRSDAVRYAREGDAGMRRLVLTQDGTPYPNIYARASVGIIEEMFAGVTAEVLWKPPTSRLGLGLSLAQVWQRDPGLGIGFGYYDYSLLMGHASVYYALTDEYGLRLDVGRYLAGDTGATVSLERRFANGWRLGAYATLTDVPFESFGEGSFDKGITLTIPLQWVTGRPSQREASVVLQPVLRDGGARLDTGPSLYDQVRPMQQADLKRTWGIFWK